MTDEPSHSERPGRAGLDQILTRWPLLSDPVQFVFRYGPAVRKYLEALLKDSREAEEVGQDFVLRVLQCGVPQASPDRGRFRDYLKIAVRHAALTHLRRERPGTPEEFDVLSGPDAADRAWLAQWQSCVLDRAWRALEVHQRGTPNDLFHTVLRLAVDHPDEDVPALAARACARCGRTLSAEAFRQQLSRARRMFAQVLVDEVTRTLEAPSPEGLREELAELGLLPFVRDVLQTGP